MFFWDIVLFAMTYLSKYIYGSIWSFYGAFIEFVLCSGRNDGCMGSITIFDRICRGLSRNDRGSALAKCFAPPA